MKKLVGFLEVKKIKTVFSPGFYSFSVAPVRALLTRLWQKKLPGKLLSVTGAIIITRAFTMHFLGSKYLEARGTHTFVIWVVGDRQKWML